jgi:hypothetical protein
MTGAQPMPSVRRRPIPGMASQPIAPPPPRPAPAEADHHVDDAAGVPGSETSTTAITETNEVTPVRPDGRGPAVRRTEIERRPAADYASTRLVNFRIPVDLHDRYKRLVCEVEQTHQRLRHPSLTEVLIGLLEEGPDTVDDVAAVIRRKRASEHGQEDDA